ncbi:MAG: AmmeMemoRadiSam system protein B [Aquificae bacterium]|nr:AmmeMemoRadiSam system protein B [Aquificota bacterium]
MKRRPAVAGTFYPAELDKLNKLVDLLCGEEPTQKIKAKAILVPHAGLIYSGKTACAVYKRVYIPERIVLLGPNHTGYGTEISVYPGEAWETPYGDVFIDQELKEEVLKYTYAEPDESAHLYEHSLEVQLPFLFRYAEHPFRILPIILGYLDYDRARDFGRFLGSILQNRDALIVISSDMSHYIPAEEAQKKDEILISAMERLATDELYLKRIQYNITMCGFIPAVVGIEASKVLGARQGILIDYTNSGEVTGDYDRVVAYAGMVFV